MHQHPTHRQPPLFADGINRLALLIVRSTLLVLLILVAGGAWASEVFTESFDTDTDSTEQTLSVYPYLGLSRTTQGVVVRDGVLTTQSGRSQMMSLADVAPGPVVISLEIGASDDSIGSSVLIEVMGTRFVFHPGWASGGGFRVDGVISNTDMGFVPGVGVMHHMTIRTDGEGNFEFELIDGENPDNAYAVSFHDPESTGNEVLLQYGNRAMMFDNITIDSVLPRTRAMRHPKSLCIPTTSPRTPRPRRARTLPLHPARGLHCGTVCPARDQYARPPRHLIQQTKIRRPRPSPTKKKALAWPHRS